MHFSTMELDQLVESLFGAFLILLATQTSDQILVTKRDTSGFAMSGHGMFVTFALGWFVPTTLVRSVKHFAVEDALTTVWFLLFSASPIMAGCIGRAVKRHRSGAPSQNSKDESWLSRNNELISSAMVFVLLSSSVFYVAAAAAARDCLKPFLGIHSFAVGGAIAVICMVVEALLRSQLSRRTAA